MAVDKYAMGQCEARHSEDGQACHASVADWLYRYSSVPCRLGTDCSYALVVPDWYIDVPQLLAYYMTGVWSHEEDVGDLWKPCW